VPFQHLLGDDRLVQLRRLQVLQAAWIRDRDAVQIFLAPQDGRVALICPFIPCRLMCVCVCVCASLPTNLRVRRDFDPARFIGDIDNVAIRVLPPLLPSQGIEAALLLFAVQYCCLVGSGQEKQVGRVSSNKYNQGVRGRKLKRTRPPPSGREAFAKGVQSVDRRGQ
jgi:hypothetical protein